MNEGEEKGGQEKGERGRVERVKEDRIHEDNSNHRDPQDASATDFAALRPWPLARSPLRARTPAEPICPLHQVLPTFLSRPICDYAGRLYPRTCGIQPPRTCPVSSMVSSFREWAGAHRERSVIKSYHVRRTRVPVLSRLYVDFQ